jgi:hypothetical protein
VVTNRRVVPSVVALEVKTSSEMIVATVESVVAASWIVVAELSATTEVTAADVSVVKIDEGRHGPALTPLMARRASALVKIENEIILQVNE